MMLAASSGSVSALYSEELPLHTAQLYDDKWICQSHMSPNETCKFNYDTALPGRYNLNTLDNCTVVESSLCHNAAFLEMSLLGNSLEPEGARGIYIPTSDNTQNLTTFVYSNNMKVYELASSENMNLIAYCGTSDPHIAVGRYSFNDDDAAFVFALEDTNVACFVPQQFAYICQAGFVFHDNLCVPGDTPKVDRFGDQWDYHDSPAKIPLEHLIFFIIVGVYIVFITIYAVHQKCNAYEHGMRQPMLQDESYATFSPSPRRPSEYPPI